MGIAAFKMLLGMEPCSKSIRFILSFLFCFLSLTPSITQITLTETGKALYDRTAITLAKHGLGVAILPSSMRELNPCLYAYSIKDME